MVKKLSADNKPRKFKVFKLDVASIYRKLFAWIPECFDRLNLFSTKWSKEVSALESKSREETRRSQNERSFHFQYIDIHSSLLLTAPCTSFNERLLEIVEDFINKTLGSNYISHHLRAEQILQRSNGNFTTLVNCIKQQASLMKNIRARHPNYNKLFVAVDFTAFSSQSKWERAC